MKRKLKKEINQEIRDVKSKIFSLEKEYVALCNKKNKTFDDKCRKEGILSYIEYLTFELNLRKRVLEIINSKNK
jgi:hypothetical protein